MRLTKSGIKLVEIRLREAQLCRDPKQAISVFFNTGLLCEEKLGHTEMAMMCYQNILSISPTYIPALQALGVSYASQNNWGGLIAMFQREAEVTASQSKRLHLFVRIAEIYRSRLEDNRQCRTDAQPDPRRKS